MGGRPVRQRFLAFDIGTQSARAIIFNDAGELLAKAQVPIEPYSSPQPGWAEQAPEIYWQALIQAGAELWRQSAVPPSTISALALTTLRSTVVCCDQAGMPLRPAIVWLDQRRASQPPRLPARLRWLLRLVGATDLVADFQAQAEANWLAQHEPRLWAQCTRYVLLSGWLTHRLTGEWVDSSGCQVGYLPFDYRRQRWLAPGDWRWKTLAARAQQLPRLVAPGTPLGTLRADVAAALGLPSGLPVIAAAADKACEALGCGLAGADEAALSFGTTATINTVQRRYLEVQRWLPAYPAAQPDAWNAEIQIYRGFWMVSWFKREFAQRERDLARERSVAVESLFDDLLRSAPPGAQGLVLQPYWSPGVREPDPAAKGAVIGFGDVHTRAHLYRAIIEGLAYGLRAGRETLEHRLRRRIRRVVAAGGGSRSDAVMQIAADVFGQPVERPRYYESAALGAAINAAVGVGRYVDHSAAVRAMCAPGMSFTPQPEAAARYDALYRQVYREIYPRLQPLYARIRRITGYPA
ncbi:MAG: FGGY-family carbohydrate kinase [Gammaproteobacteria bacterium]|nr:FGGY-family carbohydrate kinase [Gammaproteobacteria bacterium]